MAKRAPEASLGHALSSSGSRGEGAWNILEQGQTNQAKPSPACLAAGVPCGVLKEASPSCPCTPTARPPTLAEPPKAPRAHSPHLLPTVPPMVFQKPWLTATAATTSPSPWLPVPRWPPQRPHLVPRAGRGGFGSTRGHICPQSPHFQLGQHPVGRSTLLPNIWVPREQGAPIMTHEPSGVRAVPAGPQKCRLPCPEGTPRTPGP